MKVLILFFSGTGNTKFVAEKIKDRLKNNIKTVKCVSVENFPAEAVKDYDFLVFGYPVYGYKMPLFLKKYAQRMTLPSAKGIYLFCTIGYKAGNALRKTADLLSQKGGRVVGSKTFVMPGNDGLLITKKGSGTAEKVLKTDYNKEKTLLDAVQSITETINQLKDTPITKRDISLPHRSILYAIVTPLMSLAFTIFERIFMKKFRVTQKCIHCGLCEKICPSGNITIQGGEVTFDNKCYFCLRCINQCPVEAIEISWFTKGKFRYKGPTGRYRPAPLNRRKDSSDD